MILLQSKKNTTLPETHFVNDFHVHQLYVGLMNLVITSCLMSRVEPVQQVAISKKV
jgi:hypothetical protein